MYSNFCHVLSSLLYKIPFGNLKLFHCKHSKEVKRERALFMPFRVFFKLLDRKVYYLCYSVYFLCQTIKKPLIYQSKAFVLYSLGVQFFNSLNTLLKYWGEEKPLI